MKLEKEGEDLFTEAERLSEQLEQDSRRYSRGFPEAEEKI